MKRKEVLELLRDAISSRLNGLHTEMNELREGLAADTKSTSGDKHETSRAMNQLEQERLGKLIDQTEQMRNAVIQLFKSTSGSGIQNGSLVRLNGAYYLLAVAFGKLRVNDEEVFVLSPASPIGAELLGKASGDTISFNGKHLMIEDVV